MTVNRAHKKNKCVLCPFWVPRLKNCTHFILNRNLKESRQWIDGLKEEIETELKPLGEAIKEAKK